MSENRSAILLRDQQLYWLAAGAAPRGLDDEATRDALRAELARRDHRVVFAAPGGDLRLLEIVVAAEERRHLDRALPYTLEEGLAEDIESLHFARRFLDRLRCGVAVVSHRHMAAWEAMLGEFAGAVRWVPEPLLLAWQPGEWTLVFDGDSALLRYGACEGTRIETSLLPDLLQGLAERAAPDRVVVYGREEALERSLVPAALAGVTTWRRGDLGAALLLAADDVPLDLRQGAYAPQLPYASWWTQWRVAAVLATAALGLHLVSGWLDLQRLERQNLALRGEIESVYRQVNPRGAVADVETQLRRQLASRRGSGGVATVTGLLAPLAERVAAAPGVQLASLNYSQGSGELRINLLAPDFAAVETLREELGRRGLVATLETSSRSGDRVRARLRIGGGA